MVYLPIHVPSKNQHNQHNQLIVGKYAIHANHRLHGNFWMLMVLRWSEVIGRYRAWKHCEPCPNYPHLASACKGSLSYRRHPTQPWGYASPLKDGMFFHITCLQHHLEKNTHMILLVPIGCAIFIHHLNVIDELPQVLQYPPPPFKTNSSPARSSKADGWKMTFWGNPRFSGGFGC